MTTRALDVTRTSTTSGTSNRYVPRDPHVVAAHTMLTSDMDGEPVLSATVRLSDDTDMTFTLTDPDLVARFAGQMVDGSIRLRSAQAMT